MSLYTPIISQMIASNRRGLWKLFSLLLCCIYGVQPIMKSTTKYSLGQQAFSPRGHADHSKQTIKWCIVLANTCPTFSLEIYRFKPTPPLKKRRKKTVYEAAAQSKQLSDPPVEKCSGSIQGNNGSSVSKRYSGPEKNLDHYLEKHQT